MSSHKTPVWDKKSALIQNPVTAMKGPKNA
jgi:hypothetical protein